MREEKGKNENREDILEKSGDRREERGGEREDI
jgi:hypothetical protein